MNDQELLDKYGSDDVDTPETESTETVQPETSTDSEAQPETDANQPTEGNDLASQLNALEVENSTEGGDLLSLVNELGITRQGLPVEFEDIDKIKEHLSKGFDYTAKTQEHAEIVKAKEAEFAQKEQEYEAKVQEVESYKEQVNERLVENQIMEQAVLAIQQADPDLFAELTHHYNSIKNSYNLQQNHPVLQGVNKKVQDLEAQLAQFNQGRQEEVNTKVVKEWESGLSEVQSSFGNKLKSLGVKPNWEKVKATWSSDTTNSTSVQEAFFAVHGSDITKALDSKSKLMETKAKSALRQGPSKIEQDSPKDANKEASYLEYAQQLAAKYA